MGIFLKFKAGLFLKFLSEIQISVLVFKKYKKYFTFKKIVIYKLIYVQIIKNQYSRWKFNDDFKFFVEIFLKFRGSQFFSKNSLSLNKNKLIKQVT